MMMMMMIKPNFVAVGKPFGRRERVPKKSGKPAPLKNHKNSSTTSWVISNIHTIAPVTQR